MAKSPIPAQGNPQFRYLAGGDGIAIRVWRNPSDATDVRVWSAEDGGRIRYSPDRGASWVFQDTPFQAAQKLLDVFFLADGETGFACGQGGRLLQTSDHGDTWAFPEPSSSTILDGFGDPAILWSVRFLDASKGFLAGKYVFRSTRNAGIDWAPLELYADASLSPDSRIDPTQRELEFYTVTIVGNPASWVGFVGAEWKRSASGPLGSPIETGVLFRGESDVAGGSKWWKVLENRVMKEPWDLQFESDLNGFLVGGTGSIDGKFFSTTDGGTTWLEEKTADGSSANAVYGLTALGNGKVIACGYGGQIWARVPTLPGRNKWILRPPTGFTGPLNDADGIPGTDEAWINGSFGFLRHTTTYGVEWEPQNSGEVPFRAKGVHFLDRDHGVLVGQASQIYRSSDGGSKFTKVHPIEGGAQQPNLRAIAFATPQAGLAVGTQGTALATADAGVTWGEGSSRIPIDVTLEDVAVRAGPAGPEYWAVGFRGGEAAPHSARVLRSRDLGRTWTDVSPAVAGARFESIAFASANEAFIVGWSAGRGIAFRLVQPDTPVWMDVSLPADPSGTSRGLLAVCSGLLRGIPATYAAGEAGTLVRWNGARFVSVPDVYQFDPGTGVVTDNRYHQDFTAAAIAPGVERLLVGRETRPDASISQESGYVLVFDGLGWTDVKCQTNKDARGFSFVQSGTGVTGFLLGNPSEENARLDDGVASDMSLILWEPPA